MGKITTVSYRGNPLYNISLETGFENLKTVWKELNLKEKRVCLVTDSNVSHYHMEPLVELLKEYCQTVLTFILPAGEENKQISNIIELYAYLIEAKFDRNDVLFALGGGVVGDMTGFAAATFLRGISFVQIPTSLLAMVDSSIGGKTGIDFDSYKNMVGAFHQPQAVCINLKLLETLPEREFYSGFGEIIKHGLIKDKEYFIWLKEHAKEIMARKAETLEEMIYRSNEIKRCVVENDPEEKGERALLNFGHTLGHSIEKFLNFKLLHGECVALGIVAACYISVKRGMISEKDLEMVKDILQQYHLSISYKGLETEKILEYTKNDKKMVAGRVKFILLDGIGNAIIDKTVEDEEMKEALQYLFPSYSPV